MSPFGVRDDDRRRRRRRRRRLTKPGEMPDSVERLENNLTRAGILLDVMHRQKSKYPEREFPSNFNTPGLYRVRLVFPYELTASNDDWGAMKKVFTELSKAMEDDKGKGATYFEYSTERWCVANNSFWCFIGDSDRKKFVDCYERTLWRLSRICVEGEVRLRKNLDDDYVDDDDEEIEQIGKKDGDDDIQAYFAYIKNVDKEELEKEEEKEEEEEEEEEDDDDDDDYEYSELFEFLRVQEIVYVRHDMVAGPNGVGVPKPIKLEYNVKGNEEQLRKAVKEYVWGRYLINDLVEFKKEKKIPDVSADEEKKTWQEFHDFIVGVREACGKLLTEPEFRALDDDFAKLVEKKLENTIETINKENEEELESEMNLVVDKIRQDAKDSNISLVAACEAALNVKVYGVHGVLTGEGKDNESRKTKDINDILGMEFEGPTEDEIDRVSEGFRGMFDIEDDAARVQLNSTCVVAHRVDYAKKKVKDDLLGEFVFGKDANKDINEKITNGGIVIVENTVAFSTYPVGDENSIDGENWNTLTGAKDCCGDLQRYWKNLQPIFATIARVKLKTIQKVFSNVKSSSLSFYTAHVDATSYIAPGGTTGEAFIQAYVKEDLKRNTEQVLQTLAKHGFKVHIHSMWLFRDYIKENFGFKSKESEDDKRKSKESEDDKRKCRNGTLSVVDNDGNVNEVNVTVSPHKSMWFYNGGHLLIVDCVRSALETGGEDFAEAASRNSVNYILNELAERFAEYFKGKEDGKFDKKKLLGENVFVHYLFSTWTNRMGWLQTQKAIESAFKELLNIPGYTVSKVINAITYGACARLFKKHRSVGDMKSDVNEFFALYWHVRFRQGMLIRTGAIPAMPTAKKKRVKTGTKSAGGLKSLGRLFHHMFSQTFLPSCDDNDNRSCHFCTDEIYGCHKPNSAMCGPAYRRVPDEGVNKNIPEKLWGKPCCRRCYDFWFSYKRQCTFVGEVVYGVKIHTGDKNVLACKNIAKGDAYKNPNIPKEYEWVLGQPSCENCARFWRGFGWECFLKGKEGEYACRSPDAAGASCTVPSVELEGLPADAIGQRCCNRCYNCLLLKKEKKKRQQLQKKSK